LNESVRTILERGQAQAATRNISLEYVPHEQVVPLRGNQSMIERILMILIDNAVRYTPAGRKDMDRGMVTPEHGGFIVRDTGIGIARHHHERVFERFFRVDEARSRHDGGYGLGLSMAKSLIKFHGGTGHVDSEIGRARALASRFSEQMRRARLSNINPSASRQQSEGTLSRNSDSPSYI
jgi:signal transduction histidine kinase